MTRPPHGTPVLSARALRKEYGKGEGLVRAVAGVDLDVGAGETVAITGPSGCGKSTLLHLLGGLDRPSGGEVRLNGRRIDNVGEKALARMRRTDVSYVFQSFHLMEELTAVENVELPALLAGRPPRAARRRAEELLKQVGLAGRSRFLPSALSGGQRQRVAVARALITEPLLVLADEPTGNLDTAATEDVLELFETLHKSGQTLIIVTHDPHIAATATRTLTMHDGTFATNTRPNGTSTTHDTKETHKTPPDQTPTPRASTTTHETSLAGTSTTRASACVHGISAAGTSATPDSTAARGTSPDRTSTPRDGTTVHEPPPNPTSTTRASTTVHGTSPGRTSAMPDNTATFGTSPDRTSTTRDRTTAHDTPPNPTSTPPDSTAGHPTSPGEGLEERP